MSLKKFAELPPEMQNRTVWSYYRRLQKKRMYLSVKRACDLIGASLLLALTVPLLLAVGVLVALTSPGGALYVQHRITRYGQAFSMYKFRTMHANAGGCSITLKSDGRITPVGSWLRRTRIDELPQLFNVIKGELSLIGPRPEVPEYVAHYSDRMRATLLLAPGILSEAGIRFRNEADWLCGPDPQKIYAQKILPAKMRLHIAYLKRFSLLEDCYVILCTLAHLAKAASGLMPKEGQGKISL